MNAPSPDLHAACEADIASLTGQRNRVSETADQLRAQVRNLRDALERCRDAAGTSPAAVHTIASQALASSAAPGPETPASGEAPVYRKVQDGSNLWLITVDEGWRNSILCSGMYERDADFLLSLLGRTPRGAR